MEKINKVIFGFLFLFILIPINAYAGDGSISGIYSYDGMNLSNVEVKIYQIAEFDNDYNFLFINEFKSFEKNIFNLTSSELEDFALEIDNYITKKGIISFNSTVTNSLGYYKFDNLVEGLYLVKYVDSEIDNYKYISSPILLTIPYNYDVDSLVYDVTTKNKITREIVSDDCPDCINNINSPYTYDGIMHYIIMFIGALTLIVILMFYIKFRARKEVKNEKK